MIAALGAFFWTQVWPNVLASAIWAAPAWVWAHRHVRRLHRRHDELHAAVTKLHADTDATTEDTNRLVRALADSLGIDPETGENRLPRPRT